jgi:hypothetical protein
MLLKVGLLVQQDMTWLETLWCWLGYIVAMMRYSVIEALDFVVDALLLPVILLLGLLPTFTLDEPQLDEGPVGWIAYFIPIGSILVGFTAIMTCWILYRLVVVILRWTKVADDS